MERQIQSKRRVVLIGASNLAMSFPLVVEGLRAGLGDGLDILAALGHGRSYGLWTQLLGRELPGIVECDLWRFLHKTRGTDPPPLAAVLDVGNDLVYGVPVPQVLDWLETCLRRLNRHHSEIVLLSLPLESVGRLPPWRFELVRRTLFPAHPIPQPLLLDRLHRLHEQMGVLAQAYNARLVHAPAQWYGLDPIHIRPDRRPSAWREVFSRWSVWNRAARIISPGWPKALGLRVLRPARRILFGQAQLTPQPVFRQGALSISLF
jgi:hypothetical protein